MFDGSTSRLELPSVLREAMGNDFTVTMWVWIDTTSEATQQLIKINAGNSGVMLSGGKLYAQANGDAEFPGFPGVSLGEWHFVALAMDRDYMGRTGGKGGGGWTHHVIFLTFSFAHCYRLIRPLMTYLIQCER